MDADAPPLDAVVPAAPAPVVAPLEDPAPAPLEAAEAVEDAGEADEAAPAALPGVPNRTAPSASWTLAGGAGTVDPATDPLLVVVDEPELRLAPPDALAPVPAVDEVVPLALVEDVAPVPPVDAELPVVVLPLLVVLLVVQLVAPFAAAPLDADAAELVEAGALAEALADAEGAVLVLDVEPLAEVVVLAPVLAVVFGAEEEVPPAQPAMTSSATVAAGKSCFIIDLVLRFRL